MPKQPKIKHITESSIAPYFDHLAHIGNLGEKGEDGFLRYAWSDEESAAFEYIRHEAEKAGLQARYDAVGNLYLRTADEWDEVVLTGSHMDSVPKGGNFDGIAGVVTGLEAIKAIKASGVALRKGLELVLWRGEEAGTFEQPYKGCKAAFGQLDAEFLQNILGEHVSHSKNKITLEEAIRSQRDPISQRHFDPSLIKQGISALSLKERDSIAAFVELHIEQANKLEHDGDDIGIVTSIRAPARCAVILKHDDYHDIYLAQVIVALSHLANKAIVNGLDLVQTFGLVNLKNAPHGSELHSCGKTKVPGYSEVRVNKSYQELQEIVEVVANEFNVDIEHKQTEEGCLLRIRGAFDHSGATPMGVQYRRDANLTAAYIVTRAYDRDYSVRASINYPDKGYGNFLVDIRSNDKKGRDKYVADVLETIDTLKRKYHLKGDTPKIEYMPPVEQLEASIQHTIEEACRTLGCRYQYMSSGAGHDAAVVAKQTRSDGTPIPVGMIFIPCREGKSHCKEEFTTIEAITKGANVLAYTLYQLAK